MILPWQSQQWNQLTRLWHEARLPHALLLTGLTGIGKAIFADKFSQLLFCATPINEQACGECHACRLIAGRAHPNVLWVEPEKEGGAIKVDQIRDVTEFINQSSLQGAYRVVILYPANNMNINAANALLKTLEEPSAGALLILITDLRNRLPATILSRCQRMVFSVPPQEQALAWVKQHLPESNEQAEFLLQISQGAPLAAVELMQEEILTLRAAIFQAFITLANRKGDPLQIAAKLPEADGLRLIDLAISWMCDLARLQLGISDITNRDYQTSLQQLVNVKNSRQLQDYLQYLRQLRKQLAEGMNLNKQLVTESVFLKWTG